VQVAVQGAAQGAASAWGSHQDRLVDTVQLVHADLSKYLGQASCIDSDSLWLGCLHFHSGVQ